MHRTNRVLNPAFAGLFLGLLLSGLPMATARAQAPKTAGSAPALIIPINGTQAIQMSTKKKIKSAVNTREVVARIQELPGEPTKILITGLDAGVSHLTLTDEDGKVEELDVVVQTDVEFLRTQIKRTVPSANVEPIPVSSNTIILQGTVNSAEDVDTIMAIARGVAGNQVFNHMKVAGVQQVQLCVTIAAVSRSEFRAMNFDWILNRNDVTIGSLIGGAISVAGGTVQVGGGNSAQLGNPNGAATNIFFGLSKNGTNLLVFFQALKTHNVVKLLAEPRIVTLSGRPASFLSGGEQAVPIPAGLGQVGVQFEEFGTRVNLLPVILGEGKVHLEIEPEVSNLDANFGTTINGTTVPGRKTQRVHTTVELEDGQTFVIGGLIQRDLTGTTQKVPILGEIPFLAPAFSSNTITETEQELVVLVTPHLVDAMSCDQVQGKLLPGQETRTADDFELFLEGILEAPRGQRQINFPLGYQAAYKNGPSAKEYPCGVVDEGHGFGFGGCRNGSCGAGSCGAGSCANGTAATPAAGGSAMKSMPNAPATKGDSALELAPDTVPNSQPTATTGKPTVLPPLPAETNGEKP
jgi:pilus assembly protein CpaC